MLGIALLVGLLVMLLHAIHALPLSHIVDVIVALVCFVLGCVLVFTGGAFRRWV